MVAINHLYPEVRSIILINNQSIDLSSRLLLLQSMMVFFFCFQKVIKICRPLIVEDEVLKALTKRIADSITKSLSLESAGHSTVKSNLTYITDFPDGTGTIKILKYFFFRIDRSPYLKKKKKKFPLKLFRISNRERDFFLSSCRTIENLVRFRCESSLKSGFENVQLF